MKLKPFKSGFTVIELLVSTAIIIIILGIVMAGYPKFRARSSLNSIAREVGLLIREAQVYGLAVKEFTDYSDPDEQFPPYGVHVSMDKPKEFILFVDLIKSGAKQYMYDSGSGCGAKSDETECIKRFSFGGPEFIDKICVIPGGGQGGSGASLSEICDIDELNISFQRPDPEAIIVTTDPTTQYNGAKIYLRSGRDSKESKEVRVWITGQISVE